MRSPQSEFPSPAAIRLAGALYAVVIAGGLFNEAAVMGTLAGRGAAGTAAAIAANEGLWRWGMGIHLLYLPCAIIMNVLIYRLFKPVEPTLALLALAFSLVALAIEASFILQLSVPLALARDGGPFAAIGEPERQALGYLAIRLYGIGFGFALFFFSGFCTLVGVLILKSGLLPKLVGAAMLSAGVGYMASGLIGVVSPTLADLIFPWILIPCFLGEASVALWLLLRGVKMPERSKEAVGSDDGGLIRA